jgi:hypothetical protein
MLKEQHREGEKSDWVRLPHVVDIVQTNLQHVEVMRRRPKEGSFLMICTINLNLIHYAKHLK